MAAAYAALVSLFNTLELIQNHPRHSFSFDNNQIQSLLETVCFLIDFMETCDNSHGASKEVLERQIAGAAHAAEEVVESHVIDQIRGGSTLGGKTISRFLLDLQNVIEEMDFVRRKAIKVKKAQSGFKAEQSTYSAAASSTPLTSVKNTMVGLDDGLVLKLMDMLTGEPSSREVIPIVGTGGIGKTTLAENAFEHKSIVRHFDVCIWATISQQYSVKEILLQLLSRQDKSTAETVEDLGEQLHKKLWGRRYLIVLDDIWSVEAWDKIQLFLPDDGISKSRVVLTTRLQNVADCFGSSCLAMNFLDEEKSWILFCEKAFAEQGCPPELEYVGKKIVKKCRGLPLAIVVVAGHLGSSSRRQEYWEEVANHMNSILNSGENNEQLLKMLSLSYSHLPIHLKPCFLYMGTFREDGAVDVLKLVELWIAEGFLKPNKGQSLEEIAEGYLRDLIVRNLIFISRLSLINGEIGNCKIHDVLRELCLNIAEEEKFFHLLHISRTKVVSEERIPEEMMPHSKINHALRSAPLVRSLKCQGDQQSFDLKLLRVQVNRVDRGLTNEVEGGFLEANFQQVNLRYLCCLKVDRKYKTLPSLYLSPSVSLVWNLQTIIIEGLYPLVIAPYEIWEMVQLRHAEFRRIALPSNRLDQANDLVLGNLQTLRIVENLQLSEEVCKRIPNIKELGLTYRNVEKVCDYCPLNLVRFHKLASLTCSFSVEPEWRDFALSLTVPSSIKELSLSDSRFEWEELTMMVGSLPHLEILLLFENSAVGSEWNPVQGKFRRLTYLRIKGCDDLVYWNADKSNFPVLERVILEDLSELDEFPSSIGDIPTIRYICLRRCSVSSAVSAMKMLVEQEEDYGNDSIILEVSFSGDDEKLQSFYQQVKEEALRTNNLRLSVF